MKLIKLPSGKIVNVERFISMCPTINADNSVRFDSALVNLGEDDAQALYNWLEDKAEPLRIPRPGIGWLVDGDAPVEPMNAKHILYGNA